MFETKAYFSLTLFIFFTGPRFLYFVPLIKNYIMNYAVWRPKIFLFSILRDSIFILWSCILETKILVAISNGMCTAESTVVKVYLLCGFVSTGQSKNKFFYNSLNHLYLSNSCSSKGCSLLALKPAECFKSQSCVVQLFPINIS